MKSYSTKLIEINGKDEDFAGFKWILKAVDFDPGSPITNVLSIEKESIIATDGHRLHIYSPHSPLESYPTGTFKVLLRQRYYLILAHTKDVKFPDYERVIPDYSKFKEFLVSGIKERDYATIIKNMVGCAINFRYFSDLTGMDMEKIFIGGEKDPVVFEGFRKQALIMPMRI